MELSRAKRLSLLFAFFLPLFFLVSHIHWPTAHLQFLALLGIAPVHAETEDQYENEFENESFISSSATTSTKSTKKKKTKPQVETVVEMQPVTKTIQVTDPAYTKDTDGDGIVDPLDPHPNIDERQFFTDDDGDGVPNILDKFPGQDDFSVITADTDHNSNGLIDAYE